MSQFSLAFSPWGCSFSRNCFLYEPLPFSFLFRYWHVPVQTAASSWSHSAAETVQQKAELLSMTMRQGQYIKMLWIAPETFFPVEQSARAPPIWAVWEQKTLGGRNDSVLSAEKAAVLSSSTRHRFTCQQRGGKNHSLLLFQWDKRSIFPLSESNKWIAVQRFK